MVLSVQVEDAVLDTYDLVFDQAVKNLSGIWRQELAAIQDTVSCWGRPPPGQLRAGLPPQVDRHPENGHRAAPGVSGLGTRC